MQTGALDATAVQTIVTCLYRLFRVGSFHALENDAVTLATDDTIRSLSALEKFDREGITLVFTGDTVIVNGQLLQADPEVYESAMDFSRFLTDIEMNAISIGRDVARDDLRALLQLFVDRERSGAHIGEDGQLSPNIRVRYINPDLLLGLEDDRLSPLDRILLTYALTALVIRRLFESVSEGGFDLAGYFKRLSRQLSRVNYTDRPVVFDIILSRHMTDDSAKRSVNSALLAIAMARRVTSNEISLSRVAMAALLLSVGEFRPRPPNAPPADDALSTAIVNMAMGELFGDSLDRTIIGWEGMTLLRGGAGGAALYPEAIAPAVEARLVRTARACVEHMLVQPTIDAVLEALLEEAADALDRTCLALLIDAIAVLPRGTVIETEMGWRGVVLRAGRKPSHFGLPTARLLVDARGQSVPALDVDLSDPKHAGYGAVARVLSQPNAILRAAAKSIDAPVSAWLSAFDDDAHAAIEALELARSDRDVGASEEQTFGRNLVTIAAPIVAERPVSGAEPVVEEFARTPSSVSKLRVRDLSERDAASEFRRRASRQVPTVPATAQATPPPSVRSAHTTPAAAVASAPSEAPAATEAPAAAEAPAAPPRQATPPPIDADRTHEESAGGFERMSSARVMRRAGKRDPEDTAPKARPERLSADVEALLKGFVED